MIDRKIGDKPINFEVTIGESLSKLYGGYNYDIFALISAVI